MAELYSKNMLIADLEKPLKRKDVGVVMANGDENANRFCVRVERGGVDVDLTGHTVKGFLILPSDETLELEGTVTDGMACVDIPESGYEFDGAFTLTVKVYGDSIKKAVAIFDGQIARSISDAVIKGDRVVYTSEKILAMIEDMEKTEKAASEAATAATTAAEAANSAAEAATTATASANAAAQHADAAGDQAVAMANNAQSAAQTAQTAAQNAQTAADDANAQANAAMQAAQAAGEAVQNADRWIGEARDAAEYAQGAAASANSAANKANAAAGRAPYIGENGNWYTWDTGTNAYVDTGVASGGGTTGGSTGGGLPAGGEPNQMLVTDSNGNTTWADRPIYSEYAELTVYPETALPFNDTYGGFVISDELPLELGKTYSVIWNGVEYQSQYREVTAEQDGNVQTAAVIGNVGPMGIGDDTGEPFVIVFESPEEGVTALAMDFTGAESATLSILFKGEVTKKLDLKYLPDGYPGEAFGKAEILPETVFLNTDGSTWMTTTPLNGTVDVGNTYTVKFNGTEYETKCQLMEEILPALGNVDAVTGTGDTGEPFVMAFVPDSIKEQFANATVMVMLMEEADDVVASVSGEGMVIKKIDMKYLPDGLPYVQPEDVVVLAEATYDTAAQEAGSGIFGVTAAPVLKEGVVYRVKWNGVEYKTRAGSASGLLEGAVAIGSLGDLGYVDDSVPFGFLCHATLMQFIGYPSAWFANDGSTSVTAGIVIPAGTVYKIDEEFLPDTVAKISDIPAVPVQSVNGKSGAVALAAEDVGALPSSATYVKSVNGKSGVATLTASDVGALPSDTVIPSIDGLATEDYVNEKMSSAGVLPGVTAAKQALVTDENGAMVWENKLNFVNGTIANSIRTSGAKAEDDTYKMGMFAYAEGQECQAPGYAAHAEGIRTVASGGRAHVEGFDCVASGDQSHAEGYLTRAASANQHVQGKFNVADTEGRYAHIVGNGSDGFNRANIHTIDWAGNAWLSGDVFVGGTSQDDAEKLLKASDVAFPVAQAGVDLEAVTVVETTAADLNATDNDAHFVTEALVVNSGPYKLTKDGMLALVDKKVTGDGSVQWNGWGSMTWGDTASMLSGELKVRYMDDPIYMSMKLPSEQYHASNVIEHPGMRHANSTGAYTYLSTIGAVYAPDYTALPDEVTICIGNMSLYTLSDEPSANWVLHEHCDVPAGFGMYYIPWSACDDAHVAIPESKIERHENYIKFTMSKSDFAPSTSVSASTGAVLHFWAQNNVDIDLTRCKAAIAMYEMWTETEAAADLLYIDIGADQKTADKSSISQLFWSRNYNIRTEKRLVCGHNISDALYDELRDTKGDPRHVLAHYYAPIAPAVASEDVEELRQAIDDMYVVSERLATANLFDGVMTVGHFNSSGTALPSYTEYLMSVNYTAVTGGKSIMSILAEKIIGNTNSFYVVEYDSNKAFIKRTEMRPSYNSTGANNDSATVPKVLTLDASTAFIRFSVYCNGDSSTIEDLNAVKIAIAYTESNLTAYVEPFVEQKVPFIDGAKLALRSPNGTLYTLAVSDSGALSATILTV